MQSSAPACSVSGFLGPRLLPDDAAAESPAVVASSSSSSSTAVLTTLAILLVAIAAGLAFFLALLGFGLHIYGRIVYMFDYVTLILVAKREAFATG